MVEETKFRYCCLKCDLKARFPLFGASWGQMRLLGPPKIRKKKERPSPKDVLCSSRLLSSFMMHVRFADRLLFNYSSLKI